MKISLKLHTYCVRALSIHIIMNYNRSNLYEVILKFDWPEFLNLVL